MCCGPSVCLGKSTQTPSLSTDRFQSQDSRRCLRRAYVSLRDLCPFPQFQADIGGNLVDGLSRNVVQAVAPTGETTDSRAVADEGGGISLVVVIVVLVLCCCAGGVLLKAKAKSSDKGGDNKPEDSSQSIPSTGTGRGPPPRPPSRPVRQPCSKQLLRLLHTPALIPACLHFVLTAGRIHFKTMSWKKQKIQQPRWTWNRTLSLQMETAYTSSRQSLCFRSGCCYNF